MTKGTYTKQEIKQAIDEATQFAMYQAEESQWDTLFDLRSRLYEQFDIEE